MMIKSIHSDIPVRVTFTNTTQRNIDLFWIDFSGLLVRYQKGLQHAGRYHINTYETHPWIAKDSKTGSPLLIKNDFVYYPESSEEEDVQQILVTLPVYSLVDRCLDALHYHGVNKTAESLEIPASLKQELKRRQIPNCREYN